MITIKQFAQELNLNTEMIGRILRSNGLGVGRGGRYEWRKDSVELKNVLKILEVSLAGVMPTPLYVKEIGDAIAGKPANDKTVDVSSINTYELYERNAIRYELLELWRKLFGYSLFRIVLWGMLSSLVNSNKYTESIGILFGFLFIFEIGRLLHKYVFSGGGWEDMPGRTPQAKVGKLRRGIGRSRGIF